MVSYNKRDRDFGRKKLLAILESHCVYDGKTYGTKSSLYVFIKNLLPFFKEITICAPTKRITGHISTKHYLLFQEPEIKIMRLPYWRSFIDFCNKFYRIFPALLHIAPNLVKATDFLWVRLPSLSGIMFFLLAKIYHKPIVIDIGGNICEAWRRMRYQGAKKILAKLVSFILHKITTFMVSSTLTIVTGKELYDLYKGKAKSIASFIRSSFRERDLTYRINTCEGKIIKLLYVGQMLMDKGIFYFLDAIRKLLDENYPVKLTMVGSGPDENKIRERIKMLEISNRVKLRGYIPFGKHLFQIYRDSDILIMPSASYPEGFPRVIIEAFAFSLPVIATDIGGARNIVVNEETGLLIRPRSSEMIYQAVKRIINDEVLRKKVIRNSYIFAKQHTMEKEIRQIINEILFVYPQLRYQKTPISNWISSSFP